jgi:hypothetical protein
MGLFNRKPRIATGSQPADATGESAQVPAKTQLPPPEIIIRQFIEDGKWGADTVRRAGRQLPPTFRWVCLRCKNQFQRKRPAELSWWTFKEGPHVCPGCQSYAHTIPLPE